MSEEIKGFKQENTMLKIQNVFLKKFDVLAQKNF